MKHCIRIKWFLLGIAVTIIAAAAAYSVISWSVKSRRYNAPPENASVQYPYGAINLDEMEQDPNSELETSIADSIMSEPQNEFDRDFDGVREYDLLALSGGGSNGAFGAGILCGWTESGTRPEFKIVTGVSTGALQAPAAFLGPEYDYILEEMYTRYDTRDIYTKRFVIRRLTSDAINCTDPLKELIAHYVTSDILKEIAARHAAGRRLFIGTTNMDTQKFIIWDMGLIASSGRPDALKLFRKILLASASIPVLFPPVYFEVESGGKKYYEMHSDGGAYAQVFFRGFLLDFQDGLEDAAILPENVSVTLYVINNSRSLTEVIRKNVTPTTPAIASAAINNLFNINFKASIYRMYILTSRYDIDFKIATIGQDLDLTMLPHIFDKNKMRKLFDYSYNLAKAGYEWIYIPPGLDQDEIYNKKNKPRQNQDSHLP